MNTIHSDYAVQSPLDHKLFARQGGMMEKRHRKMDPEGKRAAVLDSAEHLFAERGFAGVAMADIACAADVAVGTVYRLFPDKPALLASLHMRMEDRFIQAMLQSWRATPEHRKRLGAIVTALLKEAEILSPLMPLYSLTRDLVGTVDYRPGERTIAAITPLYLEGRSAGVFQDMNAGLAARIAYTMVDGAMQALLSAPQKKRRQMTEETMAVFERAFLKDRV